MTIDEQLYGFVKETTKKDKKGIVKNVYLFEWNNFGFLKKGNQMFVNYCYVFNVYEIVVEVDLWLNRKREKNDTKTFNILCISL